MSVMLPGKLRVVDDRVGNASFDAFGNGSPQSLCRFGPQGVLDLLKVNVDVFVNVVTDVIAHMFFGLVVPLLLVACFEEIRLRLDFVVNRINKAHGFHIARNGDGVAVEIEQHLQRGVNAVIGVPKDVKSSDMRQQVGAYYQIIPTCWESVDVVRLAGGHVRLASPPMRFVT